MLLSINDALIEVIISAETVVHGPLSLRERARVRGKLPPLIRPPATFSLREKVLAGE